MDIDRWMDGWMDGWIDEWSDGWAGGWMDGWIANTVFHLCLTVFGIIKWRDFLKTDSSCMWLFAVHNNVKWKAIRGLSSLLNTECLQVDEKCHDLIVKRVSCCLLHLRETFQRHVEDKFFSIRNCRKTFQACFCMGNGNNAIWMTKRNVLVECVCFFVPYIPSA